MRTRNLCRSLVLSLTAVALVACASAKTRFFFEAHEFDPDYWVPKVDRFIVVMDNSLSMSDKYQREVKLTIANNLAKTMNASVPELEYEAGLRTFGQGRCLPREETSMLYGVEEYSTSGMLSAIEMLQCSGGYSRLRLALEANLEDLAGADGMRAVIIFSDGRHMGKKTIAAARRLKDRFGDDLCLYPVLIGNDARGMRLLGEIAEIGGCGGVVPASELTSRTAMEEFVKTALLYPDDDADGVPNHLDECPDTPRGVEVDSAGCPLDSDGDGVPDHLDKCPGTPKGVKVDSVGCPLDSDGDGVPDHLDKCPNTPKGTKVDKHGCPIKPKRPEVPPWPFAATPLFEVDDWSLDAEDEKILDEVAKHLTENPDVVVEIQGHTDTTGPKRWNIVLSEWRASSAKKYLVKQGVAEDRLTTVGLGPDEPAFPNDTRAERAKNRRVTFEPAWK